MAPWVALFFSVSLLLPATSRAAVRAGTSARALLRQGSAGSDSDGSADDGSPTCSCDCCDVAIRRPGEFKVGLAGVKCTPSDAHNTDMCGAQCAPPAGDKILRDEVVDFDRFCLFECKPAAGGNAPEKSGCIALTHDEAAKVVDADGNPVDPVFLYSPASQQPPPSFRASANLLSTRSKLGGAAPAPAPAPGPAGGDGPGDPDDVDKKAAKKAALKGRAEGETQGKEARKAAANLRDLEHSKAEELHTALKESGDGTVALDPFAVIGDLNAAAMSAKAVAAEASITAAKAVESYDMGRQKIWKMALSEAGKEVLRWKKFAADKAAKEWAARTAPTWLSKAAAKAQKASAPYIEGMLRAQESVKTYNNKGFETATQARSLWAEAQKDAKEADKMPRRTMREDNAARSAIYEAREKAKRAQQMGMEAKHYFATAAEVRKGIPVYVYNAQKAANAATMAMGAPR